MAAIQAAPQRLPVRIPNPGFERELEGWQVTADRGFHAGGMRISDYSSDRPAAGRGWLSAGWRARSRAPDDATIRITTAIDARRYRGRRVRLSAMTRLPDFAAGANRLFLRAAGVEAVTRLRASAQWGQQSVELAVPLAARTIELGFIVEGTGGELEADAVRLEIVR